MSECKPVGGGNSSIVRQIMESIADENNVAVEDVEPLESSIESQALRELLGREDTAVRIDFIHGDQRVIVSRDQAGFDISVI